MTDSRQTKASRAKRALGVEEFCEDICMHLSGKLPVSEDEKPFLEGPECVDFFEDYFDSRALERMEDVDKFPPHFSIECWLEHVDHFLGPANKKRAYEGDSRYVILQLLAERQAIITKTERYSPEVAKVSKALYEAISLPQFAKVLGWCKSTDKQYEGISKGLTKI